MELTTHTFEYNLSDPKVFVNNVWQTMRYSTSWDWLMPVVEKIQDSYQGEEHHLKSVELYGNIEHALKELNIQWTYEAVIRFIEWYNQLKK